MAKTRAPLLSVEAMGSLASTITFSKAGTHKYAKYSRKPKDPKSQAQLGRRAAWRGMANAWTQLTAGQKALWASVTPDDLPSTYSFFMQYNMSRLDDGLMPVKSWPWYGLNPSGIYASPVITEGPRHVRSVWDLTDVRANWILILYRAPFTPCPATLDYIVDIHVHESLGNYEFLDAPLDAGTYYYRKRSVSDDGNDFLWGPSYAATVPVS